MYIESVQLKNFRNYQSLELEFDQGTNILFGDNAQGKTNVLEAVYLCGTTKSHKGSKDREMIHFDEEESHIRMIVKKEHISYKIDMHLKKNKAKGIAINGIPIKKASYRACICINCKFCIFFSRGFEYHKKWSGREKKILRYGIMPIG